MTFFSPQKGCVENAYQGLQRTLIAYSEGVLLLVVGSKQHRSSQIYVSASISCFDPIKSFVHHAILKGHQRTCNLFSEHSLEFLHVLGSLPKHHFSLRVFLKLRKNDSSKKKDLATFSPYYKVLL